MYLWLQLVNHKMIIYDDIQNVTKYLVLQKNLNAKIIDIYIKHFSDLQFLLFKTLLFILARWLDWLERTPENCGFSSLSGHRPQLWVPSPFRAHMVSNQSKFFSLPSSFPKINKNVFSGKD